MQWRESSAAFSNGNATFMKLRSNGLLFIRLIKIIAFLLVTDAMHCTSSCVKSSGIETRVCGSLMVSGGTFPMQLKAERNPKVFYTLLSKVLSAKIANFFSNKKDKNFD